MLLKWLAQLRTGCWPAAKPVDKFVEIGARPANKMARTASGQGFSCGAKCRPTGGRKNEERKARRPVSRVLSALRRAGRPFLWDAPHGAPHATNPGGEAGMPLAPRLATRRRPPLFGLAPGGVYPATPVTGGAVRSYRTLSPLPAGPWLPMGSRAVCFLWHFPWGRPRRPLAGTVFPWSPDFPPPPLLGSSGRPAVWRNAT